MTAASTPPSNTDTPTDAEIDAALTARNKGDTTPPDLPEAMPPAMARYVETAAPTDPLALEIQALFVSATLVQQWADETRERLAQALLGETTLLSAAKSSGFSMRMNAPMLSMLLAESFVDILADPRAKNYVELQVMSQLGMLTITVQRPGGKTANTLQREAEAALVECQGKLDALLAGAPVPRTPSVTRALHLIRALRDNQRAFDALEGRSLLNKFMTAPTAASLNTEREAMVSELVTLTAAVDWPVLPPNPPAD